MARKERLAGEQVLELSTLAPIARRYVTVDGKQYDLLDRDEIDAVGVARLSQVQQLAQAVDDVDWNDPSDEDIGKAESLNRMADVVVRLVLPALPDAARKKLSFLQKMQIAQVFRVTPEETKESPTPGENPESPSTGESGAPSSSDSTVAATPDVG